MRAKILSAACAAILLAACQSDPEPSTGTANPSGSSIGSNGDFSATAIDPGSPDYPAAQFGNRAFFDYDSYALKPAGRDMVENWAGWLNQWPQQTVKIEGHADERGTREYNLALGNRRANAVLEYLQSLGVDQNRLSVVSFGKEMPEALGSSESSYQQNRRSALIIQ